MLPGNHFDIVSIWWFWCLSFFTVKVFPASWSWDKLSMSAGGLDNPAAASAVGLASQDSTRPDCVSVTHIRTVSEMYHTSITSWDARHIEFWLLCWAHLSSMRRFSFRSSQVKHFCPNVSFEHRLELQNLRHLPVPPEPATGPCQRADRSNIGTKNLHEFATISGNVANKRAITDTRGLKGSCLTAIVTTKTRQWISWIFHILKGVCSAAVVFQSVKRSIAFCTPKL